MKELFLVGLLDDGGDTEERIGSFGVDFCWIFEFFRFEFFKNFG